MSLTPKPRLPQELMETIIDLLSEDFSTLRACALACWRLLPACRKHIFGDLAIGSATTSNSGAIRNALKFFTTHPHITPYITSLRLIDGDFQTSFHSRKAGWISREQSLSTMLNELCNLKKLFIESTFHPINWTHLPASTQKAFRQLFDLRILTHLALVMVDNFPIAAIRNLCSLQYLQMRCVSLKISEEHGSCNEYLPPRLRGLTIVDHGRSFSLLAVLLLDPAIAGLDFSGLLQLSITTYGEFDRYKEDIAVINMLLQLSSDSLTELELNPSLTCERSSLFFFGNKFTYPLGFSY